MRRIACVVVVVALAVLLSCGKRLGRGGGGPPGDTAGPTCTIKLTRVSANQVTTTCTGNVCTQPEGTVDVCEVNASEENQPYVQIQWEAPQAQLIYISFPATTPLYEKTGPGHRDDRRGGAIGNLVKGKRVKSKSWSDTDVTPIQAGDRFKYDIVLVETGPTGPVLTIADPRVVIR